MSKRSPLIRCRDEALRSPSREDADSGLPKGLRIKSKRRRGDRDACASACEGRQSDGGDPSDAGGYGGVPEVQRGAGQGGRRRGSWPSLPELAGEAGSVGREKGPGHRRGVAPGKGARGRVMAVGGGALRAVP